MEDLKTKVEAKKCLVKYFFGANEYVHIPTRITME
jgi:hypothetical protein